MNKEIRDRLTRFFSTPAPPDDGPGINEFVLRRFEKVLAEAGKALFDSNEYETHINFLNRYADGAVIQKHELLCAVCKTPVTGDSEVLHATGDVDEISIYQCERCKNLIFTKYPTTLKLKDY